MFEAITTLKTLFKQVLPPHCQLCGKTVVGHHRVLCPACAKRLNIPETPQILPEGNAPPRYILQPWNQRTRDQLYRLKFNGNSHQDDTKLYGKLVAKLIDKIVTPSGIPLSKVSSEDIFIITIPPRTSQKGHSLSTLCEITAQSHKNVKFIPNALEWSRPTKPQHTLIQREVRLKNLQNSLRVSSSFCGHLNGELPPPTMVIIVDDITTTGATMAEAKRAILSCVLPHFPIAVAAIALTHTPPPQNPP